MPDSWAKASVTCKSYQSSLRDNKPSKHSLLWNTHTHIDRYVPLTSHWPLYEVINLLKRLGSFFMASVARSRQDSDRVHVHLMVHERTMAALCLGGTGTVRAELQLESMAGHLESMVENQTAVNYGRVFDQIFESTFSPLWISWLCNNQQYEMAEKLDLNASICLQFFQEFWLMSLDRTELKPIISERWAAVVAKFFGVDLTIQEIKTRVSSKSPKSKYGFLQTEWSKHGEQSEWVAIFFYIKLADHINKSNVWKERENVSRDACARWVEVSLALIYNYE